MLPYFGKEFGNPYSKNHAFGRRVADAVKTAREAVAVLAGCLPEEVIWTSGATEANNLILKGLRSRGTEARQPRIVTQATEHRAILDPCLSHGDCVVLDVDRHGEINLDRLSEILDGRSTLVSIMAANNETGVLFPIDEISRICRADGSFFHCDASQTFGKLSLDLSVADAISVSSHKLYGPKGAGALIYKRKSSGPILSPILEGGGQERGLRSGTLNVPAIIGFGEAARIAIREMDEEASRVCRLRNRFETTICQSLPDVQVNGVGATSRLPNVSNLGFCGVDSESLVLALPGLAISTGSACTSASLKPSHVLQAMGLPREVQLGSVRFSFGRMTTDSDIDQAAQNVVRAVSNLRRLQNAW